jgi:hypothetical protein
MNIGVNMDLSEHLAATPKVVSSSEQSLAESCRNQASLDPREAVVEAARKAVDLLNGAVERVEEFAETLVVVGHLLVGAPPAGDLQFEPRTTVEHPPRSWPEAPLDLDQKMAGLARDPSSQDDRRHIEEGEKNRRAYEDALASANSMDPKGSGSMELRHQEELQKLEHQITQMQRQFNERQHRLNTEPSKLQKLQLELDDALDATRIALAKKQEREKQERGQALLRDTHTFGHER